MALRARLRDFAGGFPRVYWTLWAGALLNRIGTFVVPFLALYLTERRGFTVSRAGLVVSLYGAGATAAGPVGGWLADRLGRRATMVGGLALGGLAMIALGLAERLEVIAPATLLVGFLGESYRPALTAAIADLVPAQDRVRAFGLLYWAVNLGFAVGLTLAGLLASVSYLLLFVADGATTLLFALLVWSGVPETRPDRPAAAPPERPPAGRSASGRRPLFAGFAAPYRDRVFLLFLALYFLLVLVFWQHQLALPLDMTAHGVSKAEFGTILALNGVVIVLLQPLAARLIARRDKSRVLALASVLVALGFGMNALVHTPALYALGVVLWTLGEIGSLPVATALVADLSPEDLRGRYQGAYGLTFGLGALIAPVLGSLVLQRFGSAAVWSACLILGLAVAAGQLAMASALTRLREARLASARPPGATGGG
jgi:MFS family permease